MAYQLPPTLPWDRIAVSWEMATDRFARLDQTIADSGLREAWMRRADFEEAAAALWLEGRLVPLEDLVLYDANTAIKLPTQDLFRARSVLLSRRSLARRGPKESLTLEGILALQERRERLVEADHGRIVLDHDPDWDTRSRVAEWLDSLGELDRFPALPAAAIALHAWAALEPFQHGNGTIGRLLTSLIFWRRGLAQGLTFCPSVGLKGLQWLDRRGLPLAAWIEDFCKATIIAAEHGLERHRRLQLAQQLLARQAAGRRRSSRLPALAQLVLGNPLVSAPMASKELEMTQEGATGLLDQLVKAGVLREMTGRARFRAYGLV